MKQSIDQSHSFNQMINSIEETKQNANKKKQEFDAKTNDE